MFSIRNHQDGPAQAAMEPIGTKSIRVRDRVYNRTEDLPGTEPISPAPRDLNRGTPYVFPRSLRFPSGLLWLEDAVYRLFDPHEESVVAQRSAGALVALQTRPREFVDRLVEKRLPIADNPPQRRDSYEPIVAAGQVSRRTGHTGPPSIPHRPRNHPRRKMSAADDSHAASDDAGNPEQPLERSAA